MSHRIGKIICTLVGAVLVFMGVFGQGGGSGTRQPEWAVAGGIPIGAVLIASAFPPPPPRRKRRPPHPLD